MTYLIPICTALIQMNVYRIICIISIYAEKMEPWVESKSQKPRGELDLQEEQRPQQESARRVSDLLKML